MPRSNSCLDLLHALPLRLSMRRKQPRKQVPAFIPEEPSLPTPSPRHNVNRDSNALRASVFDIFCELGGFQQDSRIAHWMFDDPNTTDEELRSVITFREESGSKFRERLESLGPSNALRPGSASSSETTTPTSRAFWLFPRKPKTKAKDPHPHRGTEPVLKPSNTGTMSSFMKFKSKSATHLPDTIKEKMPPLPSSHTLASPPTSPIVRALSPAATFNEEEWEKISMVSQGGPGTLPRNPFLSGVPETNGIPFPSSTGDKENMRTRRFSLKTFMLPRDSHVPPSPAPPSSYALAASRSHT